MIFLTAIYPFNIYAAPKKLQEYDCPSVQEAKNCGNTCTLNKRYQIAFRPNENQSTVTWFLFEDGNLKASKPSPDCSVLNDENWICDTTLKQELRQNANWAASGMSNGVWWSEFHMNETKFKFESFTCAK